MATATEDLTGRRFGRLTVLARDPARKRYAYWHCACDCGARVSVASHCLRGGLTRSCGCLRREMTAVRPRALERLAAEYPGRFAELCEEERAHVV